MKKIFFLFFLIILTTQLFSQNLSNNRFQIIKSPADTILLDTMSIVPNSVFLFDKKLNPINDTLFTIDYFNSRIILKDTSLQNIKIVYQVLPFNFKKEYSHKDTNLIVPKFKNFKNENKYSVKTDDLQNFIPGNELDKQGNISRGITFGNNQDLSLNSDLNLQLTGKINDDLSVAAVISDSNIPIQADGNTQQIQDFDKIFISIFNQKNKLTAGDYEINKPNGYFLNYNKKVKGLNYTHNNNVETHGSASPPSMSPNDSTSLQKFNTSIQTGTAISKGKYNRINFDGIEANQGPYKLYGVNNEQFIIILSGSEKVYIDGKLLARGENNDYTIDYNAAEITFTPKQPITKDKRIIVEFEYSEKNYTRFLFYNNNYFQTKKGEFWLNIYSESDAKNQPIQQELSEDQKILLSEVGDSLHLAISQNIDSIEFDADKILYQKQDTIIEQAIYTDIYKYSTNPDLANYLLYFSYVGENMGNYILTSNNTNGRVYEWIAPQNATPQGDYEPIIQLVTPKKKQVVTFGGKIRITPKTFSSFELGVSNNDLNTFSTKHANDNPGYAMKLGIQQYFLGNDTTETQFSSSINYMFINKTFEPVENFRSTEFERDWNLTETNTNTILNEHFINFNTNFTNSDILNINYDLSAINRSTEFLGINNSLNSEIKYKNYELNFTGSILKTSDLLNQTTFLRHKTVAAKKFKFITIGADFEQEINKWNMISFDSLHDNSFKFNQFQFFLKTPDSLKSSFYVFYKRRYDFLPLDNQLSMNTFSDDYSVGTKLHILKVSDLNINITYRKLQIIDTSKTEFKPENTLLGTVRYSLKLFKNSINLMSLYEIGSGLERKKEFSYIEVMPGQGIYKWLDFNENNIKELNEFEIASFQDEASYIRVFRQSNQYVKIYSNRLSQIISIRPKRIWNNETGFKKFVSKFSNNFAVSIEQKTINPVFPISTDIFIADSLLTSYNGYLINTFSINKGGKIAFDYIYNSQKNKLLLTNGIDTRTNNYNSLIIYFKILNVIVLSNNLKIGQKSFASEFYSEKNYQINYNYNKASVSYQPFPSVELTCFYIYQEKQNVLGEEIDYENKIGLDFQSSIKEKGIINASLNYININYKGENNTSISYVMLEGLNPGNNFTWTAGYGHKITRSLQVNFIYEGRYSENNKIIHSGSVQIKAGF